MSAYYNEFDPKMADWLRQLISNGDIAPGEVDDRPMQEVTPSDLEGFDQVHWFAGVGTWSHCLRKAGWPDDQPVWTASLPCQPFSVAGNQQGKNDDRHLLPQFMHQVNQCNPDTIFGEQVTSAIQHGWLDDLHTNMEGENYALGHCVLGAHSTDAAQLRQRIFWVAHSLSSGHQGWVCGRQGTERQMVGGHTGRGRADSGVGGSQHDGCATSKIRESDDQTVPGGAKRANSPVESKGTGLPQFVSGTPVEWLYCRDGKYRPIPLGINPRVRTAKSLTISMADGASSGLGHSGNSVQYENTYEARATRLKGYGNAIVVGPATEFIRAYMSKFITEEIV